MNMTETAPIRTVRANPPTPAPAEPGRQGFLALNMQLDVINRSPAGQRFSVIAKSFGQVGVGRVHGTKSSHRRTRRHLGDSRDLISFVVSSGGRFQVEGVQGDDCFDAYGAAVLESRRESALHKLDDNRGVWSICMERAPLEPLLASIHAPLQRCIQSDNPGLRLMQGYLEVLFSLDQNCDPTLVSAHIRDLALNALGVTGDAQALVRERGVAAARLQTVLARLADDAAEPKLDPTQFAERLGLSVRYLHCLLEPTGRSFTEHLLNCRLERAVASLRDPDCRLKIAAIARNSGFSDISHFNRSFRRAFGDTPYGLRVRTARRRDL